MTTALTFRERQVASLCAVGLNTKETAYTLGVRYKSVEYTRAMVRRRLGLPAGRGVRGVGRYVSELGMRRWALVNLVADAFLRRLGLQTMKDMARKPKESELRM